MTMCTYTVVINSPQSNDALRDDQSELEVIPVDDNSSLADTLSVVPDENGVEDKEKKRVVCVHRLNIKGRYDKCI